MKIFYDLAAKLLKYYTPKETEYVREKQMLMHPGEPGARLTEEYFIKKLGACLAVLTLGMLLSLIIFAADLNDARRIEDNTIERNDHGGGEKKITLDLYKDGELFQREKTIVVGEKQYTEGETEQVFKEVSKNLDERILGENISVDHIDRDLFLPSEDEDYPVTIEWLISDHEVLDNSGHIKDSFDDRGGREVKLTAMLSCGSNTEDYDFFIKVFPKYREEEEQLAHDIERYIEEYAKASAAEDRQSLPGNVNGHAISYENSMSHTWIYVLLISALMTAVLYTGRDRELKNEVAKREREMLLDYPEIVSKLTLLLGAGLTLRAAFEKVAMDYKMRTFGRRSYACEEMLITVHRMKSGVSEYEAYLDFGKRCAVRRYTKLGALFSQNIKKGSVGLLNEMEREVHDAFEERKANARKKGEEAGTKLLFPMALMLFVVMIIVIIPAFMAFTG